MTIEKKQVAKTSGPKPCVSLARDLQNFYTTQHQTLEG